MSTKNKKLQTISAISSSWVNGSLALTHDPLTNFRLWCDSASHISSGVIDEQTKMCDCNKLQDINIITTKLLLLLLLLQDVHVSLYEVTA